MIRVVALSAVLVAGLAMAAIADAGRAAQNPAPDPPIGQIQKVRNNLFVIPEQGGNTAVFVTRTGVVLVDTKVAGNGQAILDRVAAVSDLPVTTIVNTHTHRDHTGSNEFFSPTVDVVTHENTRAHMANDAAVKDKPQAMPDRTFRDRLTIGRGPDQIDLYYFGRGHTDGDAIVVFPAVRVMHTGDLFAWKEAPIVDRDTGGSGIAYPDTLDRAVKGIRNVDMIIPGHAAVTTWAAFVEFAAFNRELLNAARAARQAGRTPQQAAAELKLPPRFSDQIKDAPTPGVEFLGTNLARAQEVVRIMVEELSAPR